MCRIRKLGTLSTLFIKQWTNQQIDNNKMRFVPVRTPNCKTAVSAALAISCTRVWEDVCVSPFPSSLDTVLFCSTSSSSKSRPNTSYCCRNFGFDKTVCARFNVRKVSTSPPGLSGWCFGKKENDSKNGRKKRVSKRRQKNPVSLHTREAKQSMPRPRESQYQALPLP